MRNHRPIIISVAVILLGTALVSVAWPYVNFYLLTRHFTPIHQIEILISPVKVIGWSTNGLRLEGDKIVQLPGFRKLPEASPALTEATKRGVEIDEYGRVIGLVRVHHWCGNDPVREHIARVDLANMLMFLKEGEVETNFAPTEISFATQPGGIVSEGGWRVGEFLEFGFYQGLIVEANRPKPN